MKASSSIASITHPSNEGVLLYNGKPYAVGLLWLTVQEESEKSLLQQRIQKTKADFYCLRQHISQQQGFGWLEKGHRRGMQAVAAVVADQLVGEWHGVFEADNGWWYVQVRSDTITPNGDRFFTSEEDAFQHFQEEAQKNIWPHSYAPEKWALPDANTREISLRNMLDNLATTTLVPANITATFGSALVRNIVLGGVFIAMVVMAGIAAMTLLTPEAPAPVSAPVRTVQPVIAPKTAAAEAVSPRQLMQQCGEAAAKLYVSIPGWKAQLFSCSVGKASVSWAQESGSLSGAKTMGMAQWPPGVAVTFSNRIMTANMALGSLPKVEHKTLPPQDETLLYMEQYLQPMGNLQIKPVTPPAPPAPPRPAGSTAPVKLQPAPPPYLDVQFTSAYNAEEIATLLEQPGLELMQMQWKINQGTWIYSLKWTYQKPVPVRPANSAAPAAAAKAPGGQK